MTLVIKLILTYHSWHAYRNLGTTARYESIGILDLHPNIHHHKPQLEATWLYLTSFSHLSHTHTHTNTFTAYFTIILLTLNRDHHFIEVFLVKQNPINVITLGQFKSDNIIRLITIKGDFYSTCKIFSK